MTRLEAIHCLRHDHGTLIRMFGKDDGLSGEGFEVWIRIEEICNFTRRRQPDHIKYGPIHLRLSAGWPPHWLHITPKQLLGFIRRNYQR
jgi:hypothetical protein